MPIPGWFRTHLETPRSDCGCLILGAAIALILGAAMLFLGWHATDLMESSWEDWHRR